MKQSQIIFRFLFPPCQDAAEPVHPAMRPFHNPATSFETGLSFNSLCFFATRTNMSCIAKLFNQISYLARIITLIKTHTLSFSFSRLRPFYWNTFYCCLYHFAIMPIGSINRQANRYAGCFGKQTAFNAFFGPVRRVWACFFPHQAGLWSWHHPLIAKTSQYLSTHHNIPEPSSRVSEKLRLLSTPESVNEPYYWNKYLSHSMRSTGSRYAIRKISRQLLYDPVLSACRRRNDGYLDVLAATVQFFPITRLKSCIGSLFSFFSSLNPFKGISAFEYIGYSGVIRIGSKYRHTVRKCSSDCIGKLLKRL